MSIAGPQKSTQDFHKDVQQLLRNVRADGAPSVPLEVQQAIYLARELCRRARELQTPDGVIVPLTGSEFALLRTFVEHPREVLDRDRVLLLMRGKSSFAFDRAVDLQLSRLRRKLTAAHGEAGNLFRTVRNEGYIFVSAVRRI